MSNNIIKYICLALLLAACQEDETLLPDLPESTDRFEVTIPLGIAPETGWSYTTDYVPMQTRSEEFQSALVDKQFAGLVMKEIKGAWYVDTFQFWSLDDEALVAKGGRYLLSRGNNIGKIDLILSPGDYKILVITAGKSGITWNPALKRGYLVKETPDDDGIIPYACMYGQTQIGSKNYFTLSREVFAGILDFTVSKTGNLHSSPQNGNNSLTLTRRVSKYRIALEGMVKPPKGEVNLFPNTEHFIYSELATEHPHAFCQGINCFGGAYYDPKKTNQEINIVISATRFRPSITPAGESYQIVTPYNSTYSSQYLFIDPENKEGIPYQISDFHLNGQSGGPEYIFNDKFNEQILYPNSITGIALQTTFNQQNGKYEMSLKPDRDPATMFSHTLEIDYEPDE